MQSPPLLSAAACLCATATAAVGQPQLYVIHRPGFTDVEHTRIDGHRQSGITHFTDAGTAGGWSSRYAGPTFLGQSTFWYDSTTANRQHVGFFDAEHTDPAGNRNSAWFNLSAAGGVGTSDAYGESPGLTAWGFSALSGTTVNCGFTDWPHVFVGELGGQRNSLWVGLRGNLAIGYSTRYPISGSIPFVHGQSAFLYDLETGTRTRLGFIDGDYVGPEERQTSLPEFITAAGDVAGKSQRYLPRDGMATWAYNSAYGLRRVGLFEGLYVDADGSQNSVWKACNDSRYGTGQSDCFYEANIHSPHAWMHSFASGETRVMRLTGPLYSFPPDGRFSSSTTRLNRSGQAIGSSPRSSGGAGGWVYDWASDTCRELGLSTPEHSIDGLRYGGPASINDQGFVLGITNRRNEFGGGISVWLHDFTTDDTRQLGLVDAEHTSSSGQRISDVSTTPAARNGNCAGISRRYIGSGSNQSVWYHHYATNTTVRLGFRDAAHTSSTGTQHSSGGVWPAGFATGESQRYNGTNTFGRTTWFYDATTGITHPLVFSSTASGYSQTQIFGVTEEGTVFGQYTVYNATTSVGTRPFAWSVSTGLMHPDDHVQGGLAANGWLSIYAVHQIKDERMQISGRATEDLTAGNTAGILAPVSSDCYPNCDASTSSPVLNVADFTCFLQRFAAADDYANCDGSTSPPTLNVADFTCYLQRFAAGCP